MEQLELSDPDLPEEFMKGNFCVNKNDIRNSELSRLAAEAETLVGIQTLSSTHHHDLSTAVISRFDENVKKL